MIVQCHSCGRSISEDAAFARIALGPQTYFVCCPMCMTALEAGQVQRRMIPRSFSDDKVAVFVEYLPALQVGGDYAYVRYTGPDELSLIVADVSGHGVTASLIMSRLSADVESMVGVVGESPARIAARMNEWMRDVAGQQLMYLTLFASRMNLASRTLEYVNCGHPSQLLWSHRKREFVPLMSMNMPIGLFDASEFGAPQPMTTEVHPSDRLFLFTDGLLELKVGEGEELGAHGVARLFESNAELACDAAATEIFRRIGVAQQKNPHDDVLAIICEMRD